MTDRLHSLTVVLDKDYREDDAEAILNAIRMVKGVMSVTGEVSNGDYHAAQVRVRHEITKRIFEALD